MTKARTLASFVSTGSPFGDNTLVVADISDLTASVAELNIMDGVTASATEMNYLAGVTEPLQPKFNSLLNVSLDGPALGVIYASAPETFTITNYDVVTTYTLSTTNGTVTRSGSTITYTPSSAGPGGFVVNGRSISGYTVEILPAPGQQAYTTAGTYSWVAPTGVTAVSIVAVGGGAGNAGGGAAAGGGGLGYKNNYTVVPGNSYTVVVGRAGPPGWLGGADLNNGGDSYFISTAVVKGGGGVGYISGTGGTYTGDGGGNGGLGGYAAGGGAGGYAGNGGNASQSNGVLGTAGTGGAGGGALSWASSEGGGGVGILGQGASGAAGNPGQPGSGGVGKTYGGGAGNTDQTGGVGAVRIIWPGQTRRFPTTNTGNL